MSAGVVRLITAQTDEDTDSSTPQPLMLADSPEVMSPDTLSRVLDGVAVATLAEWRTGKSVEARRGPAFHKIGGLVRYYKADVMSWLESHRVATSEQS